jgi:hypothetical protein
MLADALTVHPGTVLHLQEHDWYSQPGVLSQHPATVRVMGAYQHGSPDTVLVRAHLDGCLCGRGWCAELVVQAEAIRRVTATP